MVWQLVAQVAFQASQNYAAAEDAGKLQDAQDTITDGNVYSANTVNTANAAAANLVRGANNQFQAAQASLQNTLRSIGNQQKMENFGTQYNAQSENEVRVMDNMVHGKLSAQLQSAATLGALRAQAAAKGTGGSSAAIMRSVAALRGGAIETAAEDNQKYVQFDALLQKQGLLKSAINSQDEGQSLANVDYGINVAPLAQSPISPGDYRMAPGWQAVTGALGSKSAQQLLGGLTASSPIKSVTDDAPVGGGITQSGGGGSLGNFFNGA